MNEYLEMSQEDLQLVQAFCAWLDELIRSGEFEEKKDTIEYLRRRYEKQKYFKD